MFFIFKKVLNKILPSFIISAYHYLVSFLVSYKYGNPSKFIVTIGVTGTSGKSTTIYFLRQIMERARIKAGFLSSIEFVINGKEQVNDKKMTMLGRGKIHQYLRQMINEDCDFAVIEVTSEGIKQHRHAFVNFDIAVLTNLWPEHIESHGSFKKYKAAKLKFFKYVSQSKRYLKPLSDKERFVNVLLKKIVIANSNNRYVNEFLKFNFDSKSVFLRLDHKDYLKYKKFRPGKIDLTAMVDVNSCPNIITNKDGVSFNLMGNNINAPVYGEHNGMNVLAAIVIAKIIGVEWPLIVHSCTKLKPPPGRFEIIKPAEKLGFKIVVDYAFEPKAMEQLYKTVDLLEPNNIIQVFGGTGGGRDKSRRQVLGKMAGKKCKYCLVTNEDPYDEDPMSIINEVAKGVASTGKKEGKDFWKILDRGEAIKMAIELAQPGDVVLVTGKGSEKTMCVANGKQIPWDDREVIKKYLKIKFKEKDLEYVEEKEDNDEYIPKKD